MWVEDQLEIAQGVLDLFPFVETNVPHDSVRQRLTSEGVLDGARLCVGSIEDGDRLITLIERLPDLADDKVGFLKLVMGTVTENRFSRPRGRSRGVSRDAPDCAGSRLRPRRG